MHEFAMEVDQLRETLRAVKIDRERLLIRESKLFHELAYLREQNKLISEERDNAHQAHCEAMLECERLRKELDVFRRGWIEIATEEQQSIAAKGEG